MIRERMKALALFIFLLYGESWYMYCDLVHVCYMYSTVKTVYMYNKYMSHMFKSLDFFIAAMNTCMYVMYTCVPDTVLYLSRNAFSKCIPWYQFDCGTIINY